MARIIWTKPALHHLEQSADYFSLDKPAAARRFVQRVFERIEQLSTHPKSGSVPTELKGTQYLQVVIPPVRIFSRAQNDAVYIIHIMQGGRLFWNDDLLEREIG